MHPDARDTLPKLGQKLKRGSQIEPFRLSYYFNGLLLIILIHLRSNKDCRKRFGGLFLVYLSNFLKTLVWKPTALPSGCSVSRDMSKMASATKKNKQNQSVYKFLCDMICYLHYQNYLFSLILISFFVSLLN